MTDAPSSPLDAAMHSLAYVLAGVPGMYVTADCGEIVVTVSDESSEEDRNKLKRLAAMGWERWPVKIEGVI